MREREGNGGRGRAGKGRKWQGEENQDMFTFENVIINPLFCILLIKSNKMPLSTKCINYGNN